MSQYHHRSPSLSILSPASPAYPISTPPSHLHQQSQSSFRYIQFPPGSTRLDEKAAPPHRSIPSSGTRPSAHHPSRSSPTASSFNSWSSHSHLLHSTPQRHPHSFSDAPSLSYHRSPDLQITNRLQRWLPIILYSFTSLAFVVAISLYRTEVFSSLDELAHWLQIDERFGHAVLFSLIFLTTFPPIPLYSTLIILSGYTFGLWTGAIISYFAALSGALAVFMLSRTFFRDSISGWLSSTPTLKCAVRAVEKRPKLLFLIRLAPYPYNIMNCLLAASPTLTLRTYTICTALSLFKVVIHTGLGASIHSFKDYHISSSNLNETEPENGADAVAQAWTFGGIVLCIAILVYLSLVARRAVHDELDNGEPNTTDEDTTPLFRSQDGDLESGVMRELPIRTLQLMPCNQSPGTIAER